MRMLELRRKRDPHCSLCLVPTSTRHVRLVLTEQSLPEIQTDLVPDCCAHAIAAPPLSSFPFQSIVHL